MTDQKNDSENVKAPAVNPELQKALDVICDENSELTMYQRFDNLIHLALSHGFFLINRQRKTGYRPLQAEYDFQDELKRQITFIENILKVAKRNGRIPQEKANPNFDGELLENIKEMESSMGNIVATIPMNSNGNE